MTDVVDPILSEHLAAWRQTSRREPRRHARERALDAMLAAVSSGAAAPRTSATRLRPRFRYAGIIAATATIAATIGVAAAGWNAPPGSALFVVRAARQSVMLKLPGSNDAELHLEFAEASLVEAHDGIDVEQTVADARGELAAALTELPADHTSPLWARYRSDVTTLTADESALEHKGGPSAAGTPTPRPTDDDTRPEPTELSVGGGDTPRSSHSGSPAPTEDGTGGGGDDDQSGSPSPGVSPPPDD